MHQVVVVFERIIKFIKLLIYFNYHIKINYQNFDIDGFQHGDQVWS